MLKHRVTAFILFLLSVPIAFAEDTLVENGVAELLAGQDLAGIAWSVYRPGSPSSGAAGLAEIVRPTSMGTGTKVQVGSVGKTVLALGVLRLVSEDKLLLETSVEGLLPELNWQNPWAGEAPVTVRHLLEHTSGLDNVRIWQLFNLSFVPDVPLSEAFPSSDPSLLYVRSRPGSQYSYSNMGYTLLGMVIEAVTGQHFEDYLQRELLLPLGMQDSSFHFIAQSEDPALAMGYVEGGVPLESVPMILRPAGQFTTTVGDMSRLMAFMLGDGELSGRPFILPALMKNLGTPTTTDAARHGLDNGHGLALASRDRHGVVGHCHPGTTFGFRAQLCLFPEENKGFFYAINTDNERADYEKFNELFIEQLNLRSPGKATAKWQPADLADYTGLYVLSPNSMAQFSWLDYMFGSVWISAEQGGNLLLESLQKPAKLLEPVSEALFRDSTRVLPSHVFMFGDSTRFSDGLKTYRKQSILPMLSSWLVLLAGLVGLLMILLRGTWLLFSREAIGSRALLLPYFNLLAFALPVYLFTQQSFLKFGEMTPAALTMAGLSGLLPVLLIAAAFMLFRHSRASKIDFWGCFSLLMLCVLLFSQGVLPIKFWH